MGVTEQLGGTDDERIFIGTDWQKSYKVADLTTDETGATAKDVTGWAITFDIRSKRTSEDVLVTKTATIAGTFNSVLATSTQKVTVTIADTDITTDDFGASGGTFYYSLKRTDDGSEGILKEGRIVIQRATQA